MEVQSSKMILNPTLERKNTLHPTLERKDAKPNEDPKLRKACQEMETYFLSHLLKSMRSTVQSSDLFGSDKEESMFRDMLDDETAKAASQRNGIGIADMLYDQLSRTEIQSPTAQKLLKLGGATVEK
jgi:flagellar protein FlgJ